MTAKIRIIQLITGRGRNQTFNLVANNEYTVKKSNPTDEEHELIIDSKVDGKTSEIAKSDDIEPGNNVEFTFKTEQGGTRLPL